MSRDAPTTHPPRPHRGVRLGGIGIGTAGLLGEAGLPVTSCLLGRTGFGGTRFRRAGFGRARLGRARLGLAGLLGRAGLLGGAGLVVVVLRLRRRWIRVTVHGPSMLPTLAPGQRLLVRRVPGAAVRRGDLVVAHRPAGDVWRLGPPVGLIIKRAVAVPGDPVPAGGVARRGVPVGATVPPGMLVLHGDNAADSVDSRLLGFCPTDRVLGIAPSPRIPVAPATPRVGREPLSPHPAAREPRPSARPAAPESDGSHVRPAGLDERRSRRAGGRA